jgi:23S rRNA pseudouridine955/2504/2580 synthase
MAEHQTSRPGGVQFLSVDVDDSGQRLDNFLIRVLKGVPRSRLYRALRKGEIRVNKGRVRADYRLVAGDRVRIPPLRQSEPRGKHALPGYWVQQLQRRVVYEDGDLLVINKPSGLAVHGGSGLSFGLIEGLRQLRPDDRYLELVHRLDRDTSGLILIARRPAILRELHRQLREDEVDKRYLALVAGRWPRGRRVVDAPLEKNVLKSGERMVRVSASGKRAVTEFSVLERFDRATLLEARPVTGRTHQIRVHAASLGTPVAGDQKYGAEEANRGLSAQGLKRLFLHATTLTFQPEHRDTPIQVEAPLPLELERVLKNLAAKDVVSLLDMT